MHVRTVHLFTVTLPSSHFHDCLYIESNNLQPPSRIYKCSEFCTRYPALYSSKKVLYGLVHNILVYMEALIPFRHLLFDYISLM